MNLGNFGFMEWLLVLVIVLVLFGAKRLPEIGASFGKGIRDFKKNLNDVETDIRSPMRDERYDRVGAGQPEARPVAQRQDEGAEPKRLI